MPYTVHQAKTHLSRLLKEAEAGREVIVTRGKKPVARIVPIEPANGRLSLAGAYRGRIRWDDHAFDPMTDKELIESGLGYMLDAPLVPPPEGSSGK
ncbi:MAG TPA: type II toxin-antitoxin system prevent-host-death family antitoxin [Terracidiphilus sp.]|jgi:prevent-host-death family protein|nr:type II toxin-antitoxin system prevent-host-death family antitoxin [Terracidiphilus sp.]